MVSSTKAALTPRDFLTGGVERVPLPLLPRSGDGTATTTTTTTASAAHGIETPATTDVSTARFQSLPRAERSKLVLEPRTIPRELPPFPPPLNNKNQNADDSDYVQQKKRLLEDKQRAEQKAKESILAAAFSSDDDEESDWGEAETEYCSSSEEDE